MSPRKYYNFTDKIRGDAFARQQRRCAICARDLADLEDRGHHVIPVQSGNPQDPQGTNPNWVPVIFWKLTALMAAEAADPEKGAGLREEGQIWREIARDIAKQDKAERGSP